MYPKDTEKWKQFTTIFWQVWFCFQLFCIPKILKNESNSQQKILEITVGFCCFVSQRYWKMKAIHNSYTKDYHLKKVVLYPKDTEKWKQFTTLQKLPSKKIRLFCIPKILKNESNSQPYRCSNRISHSCFVSQRYWKMKAIHNGITPHKYLVKVVLCPKDTEKWKQFTTYSGRANLAVLLFCIPKILKNESNSQLEESYCFFMSCCFVSQRYWKMKAIHNIHQYFPTFHKVVLYPKDTEKWKQFTTTEVYP